MSEAEQMPVHIMQLIGKRVDFETRPGKFVNVTVKDVVWTDREKNLAKFKIMRTSDSVSRWTKEMQI